MFVSIFKQLCNEHSGFIKWLGLGFSIEKTSMSRKFVYICCGLCSVKATKIKPRTVAQHIEVLNAEKTYDEIFNFNFYFIFYEFMFWSKL